LNPAKAEALCLDFAYPRTPTPSNSNNITTMLDVSLLTSLHG
jgi:hypothetical protein